MRFKRRIREISPLEQEALAQQKRYAAYAAKVLPPVTKGSFDVITGESHLEPPTDEVDSAVASELAEMAIRYLYDPEANERLAALEESLLYGRSG